MFKSFTFAMALDSGAVKMGDTIDASKPIHAGGFTIHDFHGKYRPLTVPEVFIYSSNIGAAHMAMKVGTEGEQDYLRRFGLLTKLQTDLPEVAGPILPKRWTDLTTMTIAFGQGLAVTPHADGGRRRRAGQRRPAHPADLRAAHRGTSDKTWRCG